MAMKVKKESKIKREYFPVYGLIGLLVVLIAALTAVILYDKKDYKLPEIQEYNFATNEMVVDTSNSKCDSGEIQQLYDIANKIKFTYDYEKVVVGEGIDIVSLEKKDLYGYVFNIELTNLTDDVYFTIKNDNIYTAKEVVTVKPDKFKNGKYVYQTEYTDDMVTYTMQVYSNKGDCLGEMFRKFTFETPIYNRIAKMDICDEFEKFEYCQLFINKDVPSMDQFYTELYKYIEKEDIDISNSRYLQVSDEYIARKKKEKEQKAKKEQEKKQKEQEQKNYLIYAGIAGVVIIILGGVIALVIKFRKRK